MPKVAYLIWSTISPHQVSTAVAGVTKSVTWFPKAHHSFETVSSALFHSYPVSLRLLFHHLQAWKLFERYFEFSAFPIRYLDPQINNGYENMFIKTCLLFSCAILQCRIKCIIDVTGQRTCGKWQWDLRMYWNVELRVIFIDMQYTIQLKSPFLCW